MGVFLYDYKNNPQDYNSCQHIVGISYRWLKNVNIYMGIFLFEKKYWYYGNHLERILIRCRQTEIVNGRKILNHQINHKFS